MTGLNTVPQTPDPNLNTLSLIQNTSIFNHRAYIST